MELLERILKDLDNKDFSKLYDFEHQVAVACVEWRKNGSNNYPELLEEAMEKYRAASKISHEQ